MKRLIIADASIGLGLAVWLVAALVLPFQLGTSGADALALVAYVLVAGLLFTAGDVVSGMTFPGGAGDMVGQALLRALGLAVPAALLFAAGQLAAPQAEELEDDVCAMGGFAEMPDGGEGSADMVLDGNADCAPAA